MLRPVCDKTDEERSYLQALDDFGITELLAKLSNYGEQQEQETLAVVLIYQLTQSINAELIANYLSALALSLAEGIAKTHIPHPQLSHPNEQRYLVHKNYWLGKFAFI